MAKKALGKGLGALFENEEIAENTGVQEIKLIDIEPNKSQPRKYFDEEKLQVLCDSIKMHGVIQPIVVRKLETGFYQIIAGERRWRAARMAGIKQIPAVIKDYSNKEVMELALIENLQREDLNPIEESEGYKNLIEEFKLTQEEISVRVGKSRSAIANALRLLNLPENIKELLVQDKISAGHARSLLSLENIILQNEIATRIVNEQLSVRQTEKHVKELLANGNKKKELKENRRKNQHYIDIENKLSETFGTKVKIHNGKNKSKIEIEYYSEQELERLLQIFKTSL